MKDFDLTQYSSQEEAVLPNFQSPSTDSSMELLSNEKQPFEAPLLEVVFFDTPPVLLTGSEQGGETMMSNEEMYMGWERMKENN